MSINVEDLTREDLENIVINQSKQLKAQDLRYKQLKSLHESLEEDYEKLGELVLQARAILSC